MTASASRRRAEGALRRAHLDPTIASDALAARRARVEAVIVDRALTPPGVYDG